jgi:4-amino-4-deoxy-L-arabinose transferase-like glycosyltransferase
MLSPSEIFKNRILILFLAIIALAFVLRTARYAIEHRLDKDSVGYIYIAEKISEGKINDAIYMNPRMPPLYVSLLALGEYCGIGAETSGVIVSLFAGILLIIPVFLISKKVFGDRIGLVSAFLVATHPYLIRLSTEVMRDSLFFFLIFSAIAFAVYAADDSGVSRKWYLAGAFAGLAAMTRSEGTFFIVAIVLWLLLEAAIQIRKGSLMLLFKKSAGLLICVLAGFLLMTVPVERYLADTPSRWSIIDYRISDALRTFTALSKKEILDKEDR